MSLTAQIRASITATLTGSGDLGTPSVPLAITESQTWSSGTGADQADLVFADTRTLAASATEDLDLAGVLTNPLNATLTLAKVKAILVRAAEGNTNNVVVGGASANGLLGVFGDATDTIVVKPGGVFLWVAPGTGASVTAATGDLLKIANSGAGTGVTYDILILGASA